MPLSSGPVPYVVLLPVKPPGRGKSRLGDLPRDELATAFAMDTATACLAAPSVQQVLVVTDDARFAAALSALGCAAIPDGVSGDLNGSLVLAAREAARRWPGLVPVAMCADLPCLTAADLEAALAEEPGRPPVRRRRVRRRDHSLHGAARGVRARVRLPLRGPPSGGRRPAHRRRPPAAAARRRRRGRPGRRDQHRGRRAHRRRGRGPAGRNHLRASRRPATRPQTRWCVRTSWRPSWPEPSSLRPSWPEPSSQRPSWPEPSWRQPS